MIMSLNLCTHPNPYLMIMNPKRYYSVLSADDKFFMSHRELSTEIEVVYNDEWKNRGVLPHDKVKLQHRILRRKFPLLELVHFAYYKMSDIPEFVYNGIVNEARAGVGSATVLKDSEGEWLFTYETVRPEDSLLLTATANIMLKTYVRKPLNIPKPLSKIRQLHDYHYEFLTQLTNVKSIHKLKLYPNNLSIFDLEKHSKVIFHKNGMLQKILTNYFHLPVLNTINGNLFYDEYAPPLGDLTTVLYQIIYEYLFDRHFASKYPKIEFTRWGNEAFIINHFDENHDLNDTEILEFCDSLDHITGQVHSIYSIDEPSPQIFEDCESPYNGLAFKKQTYSKILLHDSGKVTVQRNIDVEGD